MAHSSDAAVMSKNVSGNFDFTGQGITPHNIDQLKSFVSWATDLQGRFAAGDEGSQSSSVTIAKAASYNAAAAGAGRNIPPDEARSPPQRVFPTTAMLRRVAAEVLAEAPPATEVTSGAARARRQKREHARARAEADGSNPSGLSHSQLKRRRRDDNRVVAISAALMKQHFKPDV